MFVLPVYVGALPSESRWFACPWVQLSILSAVDKASVLRSSPRSCSRRVAPSTPTFYTRNTPLPFGAMLFGPGVHVVRSVAEGVSVVECSIALLCNLSRARDVSDRFSCCTLASHRPPTQELIQVSALRRKSACARMFSMFSDRGESYHFESREYESDTVTALSSPFVYRPYRTMFIRRDPLFSSTSCSSMRRCGNTWWSTMPSPSSSGTC